MLIRRATQFTTSPRTTHIPLHFSDRLGGCDYFRSFVICASQRANTGFAPGTRPKIKGGREKLDDGKITSLSSFDERTESQTTNQRQSSALEANEEEEREREGGLARAIPIQRPVLFSSFFPSRRSLVPPREGHFVRSIVGWGQVMTDDVIDGRADSSFNYQLILLLNANHRRTVGQSVRKLRRSDREKLWDQWLLTRDQFRKYFLIRKMEEIEIVFVLAVKNLFISFMLTGYFLVLVWNHLLYLLSFLDLSYPQYSF